MNIYSESFTSLRRTNRVINFIVHFHQCVTSSRLNSSRADDIYWNRYGKGVMHLPLSIMVRLETCRCILFGRLAGCVLSCIGTNLLWPPSVTGFVGNSGLQDLFDDGMGRFMPSLSRLRLSPDLGVKNRIFHSRQCCVSIVIHHENQYNISDHNPFNLLNQSIYIFISNRFHNKL